MCIILTHKKLVTYKNIYQNSNKHTVMHVNSLFLHLCFTSMELLLRGRPPLIVTSVSSLSLLSAKVNMEVWYKLTENVNMDVW